MNKLKNLSFEGKCMLGAAITAVVLFVLSVTLTVFVDPFSTTYAEFARQFFAELWCASLSVTGLVLFMAFVVAAARYVNFEAFDNFTHRSGLAFNTRLSEKNADFYSFWLQKFLYRVLDAHKDTMHLPLGEDYTCLTPWESRYTIRDNCFFYHFDLTVSNEPGMDMVTLRRIVQNHVQIELYNYKIDGLRSSFVSKALERSFWSIYVDRITYHESQHRLTFDVLYVCTEQAAAYVNMAIQRDKVKIQSEIEVFDDDV